MKYENKNTWSHLEQAINLASEWHFGQRDKGSMPYILHPLTVMLKMNEDDIDGRIVAVLHDIIEDTILPMQILYQTFHREVVDAIVAITKEASETNKQYWTRVKANPIALRVKLKDIEHNSSPERLYNIPNKREREYLRNKYSEAKSFLTGLTNGY